MKKIYIFILFCFLNAILFNSSCTKPKECQKSKVSQKILSKTAKKLAAKHNIRCVGYAYGIMYEVEELGFRFYVHRSLDIDSARSLILDCAQELVGAVKKNTDIQPYLLETGFNIENVNIIFFVRPEKKRSFYPQISVVSLINSKLYFEGYDQEAYESRGVFKTHLITQEACQEALEKLSLKATKHDR